ncbi:MAG TPA: hypothetical protein VFS92_06605 [Planctomycetota bacterium]|nr:hypothetical protein [Planctomycetota bacterium]
MRAWAKRAALAAAAVVATVGVAIAKIEPGSETWFRVMQVKLLAGDLQVKAGEALDKTEDSAARAFLTQAAARAAEIHAICEELLEDDEQPATQPGGTQR